MFSFPYIYFDILHIYQYSNRSMSPCIGTGVFLVWRKKNATILLLQTLTPWLQTNHLIYWAFSQQNYNTMHSLSIWTTQQTRCNKIKKAIPIDKLQHGSIVFLPKAWNLSIGVCNNLKFEIQITRDALRFLPLFQISPFFFPKSSQCRNFSVIGFNFVFDLLGQRFEKINQSTCFSSSPLHFPYFLIFFREIPSLVKP